MVVKAMMRELSTALSDIALGLVAWYLAWQLWRPPVSEEYISARRWWFVAFVSLGVSALLGTLYHWLRFDLSKAELVWNWRLINLSIASMSFSILWAGLLMFGQGKIRSRWLPAILLITLLSLLLSLYNDRVIFLILQYALSLIVLAYLVLRNSSTLSQKARRELIRSVLLTGFAALFQQTGIGFGEVMNNNTVYHLIQIISAVLLARGIQEVFALMDKPPVAHEQDSFFINHLSL